MRIRNLLEVIAYSGMHSLISKARSLITYPVALAYILATNIACPALELEQTVSNSTLVTDWQISLVLKSGKQDVTFNFSSECNQNSNNNYNTFSNLIYRDNIQIRRLPDGGAVQLTVPRICSEQDIASTPTDLFPFIVWYEKDDDFSFGIMPTDSTALDQNVFPFTLRSISRNTHHSIPNAIGIRAGQDPFTSRGVPYDMGSGKWPMVCRGLQSHETTEDLAKALKNAPRSGTSKYWLLSSVEHTFSKKIYNDLFSLYTAKPYFNGSPIRTRLYGWSFGESSASFPGDSGTIYSSDNKKQTRKTRTSFIPTYYNVINQSSAEVTVALDTKNILPCYYSTKHQDKLVDFSVIDLSCKIESTKTTQTISKCGFAVNKDILIDNDYTIYTPANIRVR